MKRTLGLATALAFVLSLGSIAFAQNTNSSTTNDNMSGTMAGMHHGKHHRKHHRMHHRKHHRMHHKSGGGATNTNANQ
ncbi:MAG: hypothetical protein LC754_14805 [Acidobacteria bacterium]|nr:hypothetical protein [Acidobacteriota bacterium]